MIFEVFLRGSEVCVEGRVGGVCVKLLVMVMVTQGYNHGYCHGVLIVLLKLY